MWFVLAGFVLGFAASTLWEWYYYRKQRIRLQDQHLAELQAQSQLAAARSPEAADVAWRPAEYQSSGVFLETEEPAKDAEHMVSPAELAVLSASLGDWEDEAIAADQSAAGAIEPAIAAAAVPAEETPLVPASSPVDGEPVAVDAAKVRFRAPIPRRSLGYPDDLADIRGVGEVYRRRLYDAGIFTWRQVAQTDVETLRTITKAQASANVEEWPGQAQALAAEHGRLDAVYVGPTPDDLTAIPGIGPVSAQQFFRAGICTHEQLAAALPDELMTLLTAPVAGNEYDFSAWLSKAAELAAAKRTATTGPP